MEKQISRREANGSAAPTPSGMPEFNTVWNVEPFCKICCAQCIQSVLLHSLGECQFVPGYPISNVVCAMTAAMTRSDERIVKKTELAIAESCRTLHCAAVCGRRTVYSTFWKCG